MSYLHVVEAPPSENYVELERKIRTKQASVGVIGLGYVGLPLALELGNAGFRVTGLDINPDKVSTLRSGRSYITDVSDDQVAQAIEENRFVATSELDALAELDTVSICVPTPLRKSKDPDL